MEVEGLLRSQVADLARHIARAGLTAVDFQSDEVHQNFAGYTPVPAIIHRPTGTWFAFARYVSASYYNDHVSDLGYRVGLRPGDTRQFEERGPLEWPEVLGAVGDWLGYVRRELDADDFLSAFEAASASPTSTDSASDLTPFSADEVAVIGPQLDRIEEGLSQAAKQTSGLEDYVKAEFAYLRTELGRMQRGRWRKAFLGTLASMAMRGIVGQQFVRDAVEQAREFLWDHLSKLLSQ